VWPCAARCRTWPSLTSTRHQVSGHDRVIGTRTARCPGRSRPWTGRKPNGPRSLVPAIVAEDTFERAGQRLEDNKRFASRNSKVPSLLQGLAACSACGYGYYRTSTRTTDKKICYYRCLGSDDYRYEGGRICGNKPVRAD
jgi:site-specific DNA recombinase